MLQTISPKTFGGQEAEGHGKTLETNILQKLKIIRKTKYPKAEQLKKETANTILQNFKKVSVYKKIIFDPSPPTSPPPKKKKKQQMHTPMETLHVAPLHYTNIFKISMVYYFSYILL